MYFFYNAFLVFLFPIFFLISFLLPKARIISAKRKSQLKLLLNSQFTKDNKVVVWFHAASVGELDQARALAKVLKSKSNKYFILQSYFSESVGEKHLADPNFDLHFLLPFDFPFAYDKLISKFRPDYLVILAWDTWPNLIRNLKRSGAKTYLACASLSSASGRKKGILKKLTMASFSYLDGIFPSHQILMKEFEPLVKKTTICEPLGDTRFDSVLNRIELLVPPSRFSNFLNFYRHEIEITRPILMGSTYPICESNLIAYLKSTSMANSSPNPNFWIFPHKWEKDRARSFTKQLVEFGTVGVFSDILDHQREIPKFLLFDEMGILAFAYKFARFAYIGGGFHHRIHNTIEPAAFALAIISGPKISNAPEALVMQKLGGLVTCALESDFIFQMDFMSRNEINTREMGEKNRKFVLESRGASERICLRVFPNVIT